MTADTPSRPLATRCLSVFAPVLLVVVALLAGATQSSASTDPAPGTLSVKPAPSNGWWGPAAVEWCDATSKYTASRRIKTKIVRNSDNWSNTIRSKYRMYKDCEARQMPKTVWCTTKQVDDVHRMCINPRPTAPGPSPCRARNLDVRGVYYPKPEVLRITCVNRHKSS